jgi:DNA-binding transcriptional regulator LsrR (DeoR family)
MDKLKAIQGAIRGGYINRLITDVDCAKALLAGKGKRLNE